LNCGGDLEATTPNSFVSSPPRGSAATFCGELTTVLVCITCRSPAEPPDAPRKGPALADAVTQALGEATDITVLRVRCLGNCDRGLSSAIRGPNSWTYVFGHLNAAADGPALITGARLLTESADGLMPWRGRPEPLKRGLIARVPPPGFVGEPAEPSDVS
jgi:predicted metal-binding protein